MLFIFQRFPDKFDMGVMRCSDIDHIHLWISKHLMKIIIYFFYLIFFRKFNCLFMSTVSHCIEFFPHGI